MRRCTSVTGSFTGDADTPGRNHFTATVLLRLPTHDLESAAQRTGAKLGPAQVHQNLAGTPHFTFRAPQIADHSQPEVLVVMRAIDPHHIHPSGQKIADHSILLACLAWHRDHDASLSI